MNKQEAELKAAELVQLTLKHKELSEQIRTLKAELKEYTEIENLSDYVWQVDNGYIEVNSVTRYKLADIPADFKIPSEIAAVDTAQKAFKAKIVLSKEGKKMFKEQYPPITNLMIPQIKKTIKVIV